VPVNANCKPPHAADAIAGRLSVVGNSIFEDGTKAEWFFDESRASVRQQWAADRKAARPQVRDQDFLANNAASGGGSVSQERQRLADFENELDQVFVQLPKYALAALTAGGDIADIDFAPYDTTYADFRLCVYSFLSLATVGTGEQLLSCAKSDVEGLRKACRQEKARERKLAEKGIDNDLLLSGPASQSHRLQVTCFADR
jgi:hypothetical protein